MIGGIVARARSLWRGLRSRSVVEAEMHEEFRFHVEARVEDLVRAGVARAEAVRRASIEFGNFERYKEEARASRGLRPFDELAFSWLDVKLAFRMLRRYPGLTVIGGLAMAFGVAAGVVGFEITSQIVNPRLPLDEGERIVALQNWHSAEYRVEPSLQNDFVSWRDQLQSVEHLGAFRSVGRNLILGGTAETVEAAEISASALAVARVPPLLGRWLDRSDEAPGAPPVLVIGYDAWHARFAGDPGVVGTVVHLGGVPTTIVGVMPSGFAFPVAHGFWVPLHVNAPDARRDAGPSLVVFGRLADGVSLAQAEAELAAIGARAAAAVPETHALLHPRIVPFTRAIFELSTDLKVGLGLFNTFLLMLIVLACANVALLLFARAVTRELELAVKNALGANRARLVTQFFTEALVLAGLATLAGLGAARFVLDSVWTLAETDSNNPLPFWFEDSLTWTSVAYACVLALLAALIAGVLPALMVTRGDHRARLHQLTSGGTGTMRIGGIWTALIVLQVAVTVFFPATAFNFHRWASPSRTTELGFRGEEYLSARLVLDDESSRAAGADIGRIHEELARRLTSEPNVAGVTFASRPPGAVHEQARIELDDETPTESSRLRASVASVAFDFFDVLDAPLVSGRAFLSGEQRSAARVAIVNQAFVDEALGGRNPIGRSIRRAARGDVAAGPWHEVIGVVPELGMVGNNGGPGSYLPMDPDSESRYLIVHLRGDPASFAPRLREVAVAVEPELQLHDVMTLSEVHESSYAETRYLSRVLAVVSAVALVLSLMAIYSVVDFTVSKRTREIGVRVALGAAAHSILAATFKRPLTHIGLGIVVGGLLVVAASSAMFGELPTLVESGLLVGYVMLMWVVCLLACLVPTRRALRVQPMAALKAD